MLFLAIATKVAVIVLCVVIVWNFYDQAELRRIGYVRVSAFAIACGALGFAISFFFSTNPIWKTEFLTSGTFTDDITLFLLVFSALVLCRVLSPLLSRS